MKQYTTIPAIAARSAAITSGCQGMYLNITPAMLQSAAQESICSMPVFSFVTEQSSRPI